MYWTDVGTDTIERATMDGNSRTVLHSSGLSNAYGLTLDYDNQILYWVDSSLNRIESSSVNGSNRHVLTSFLSDPWAVTFYAGILYWTDTYYNRIYSYPTDSTASIQLVTSPFTSDPRDIRVASEDRQPLGKFVLNCMVSWPIAYSSVQEFLHRSAYLHVLSTYT